MTRLYALVAAASLALNCWTLFSWWACSVDLTIERHGHRMAHQDYDREVRHHDFTKVQLDCAKIKLQANGLEDRP